MASPVATYKLGLVKLNKWANQNGKGFSYTLKRSYKDKEGAWKDTENFNADDLSSIVMLINSISLTLIDIKNTEGRVLEAENNTDSLMESDSIPF